MKKRNFIKLSLLGTAGVITVPAFSNITDNAKRPAFEALPLAHDIDSQIFSEKEIASHHKNHFEIPASKLNNLDLRGYKSKKIFRNSHLYNQDTIQQAGSFYNHRIFFKSISGNNFSPDGELTTAIKRSFGSFNSFTNQFKHKALSQQEDGWIWLIYSENTLKITTTTNNNNPLMSHMPASVQGFPIIAMDTWKHAYEESFNSDKEAYLDAFFSTLNWEYTSERYQRAKENSKAFK